MNVNIGGVISVAFFYCLILAVGIWVGWKEKRKFKQLQRMESGANRSENIMLAGRDMGLFVGVLTMTATWVAGGYINGTCESAFTGGFLKCSTMAIGYSMSLLLGGMFFAKPMRMAHGGRGYVTMLDPFQEKYGSRIGGLLFLPALCGEIFWSAAILSALGSIFTVMLGLDNTLSIIISAAVAVTYTLIGGLYSVAYTDVIQLGCVLFGLVFCIPFVWTHPAVDHEAMSEVDWLGTIPLSSVGSYVDIYLLIILGGIPWQVYFQRVLACRSPRQAQYLSYIAALGCLTLAVPPAVLGSVARVVDWTNGTEYGKEITTPEEIKSILPLILQYLTPKWVSFIGLGAVSAAIMSSADSTVLSTSSMFVHNIYKTVFFPKIFVRRRGLRGSFPSASPSHLRRRLYQYLWVPNCFRNGLYSPSFERRTAFEFTSRDTLSILRRRSWRATISLSHVLNACVNHYPTISFSYRQAHLLSWLLIFKVRRFRLFPPKQ
ncbi:high-affinity choline transporter 1-like isoform X2 [Daphnia pulicaria]|uniref:high-affinity choline transporter 1-like isoform X2 n=1 Tax=Daphnia pulicaria TaxID=35523 RepID=UPI001EEAF449|nr:high-affinity choline transporter 1-like isoform X2 [Daphnia pulicaria]